MNDWNMKVNQLRMKVCPFTAIGGVGRGRGLVYFWISLGRDKNKWGKWSLLLISWYAPDKVQNKGDKASCYVTITTMHLFKYDTRVWRFDWKCYITHSVGAISMIRLGVIFPHLFLVLNYKRKTKELDLPVWCWIVRPLD